MASSVQASIPGERLVLNPEERREAVLDVIRGARRELVLSLFRCDDFKILDGLAMAVQRKVRVRALLTPTAKNWDKRLQDLGVFLESMGAEVNATPAREQNITPNTLSPTIAWRSSRL